jgi:DNA repair exonuclease SbcCD nuclease subunit
LPEKIVLGLGGDGLHIDNIQKNTTRGTPQDVDGSPLEIAFSYIDLCKRYVLYLSQLCNVDVYVINGNHDFYSTVFLRAALVSCFESSDNIYVCSELNPRQTFVYGESLITFVHGDDGSVKDYPIIVATENSENWGKSKWRYIFTGHLHTERELPQFGDTVVYRMPSLAGTDDWHFKKGYSGRKALIGYKICSSLGVVTTHIVPVEK